MVQLTAGAGSWQFGSFDFPSAGNAGDFSISASGLLSVRDIIVLIQRTWRVFPMGHPKSSDD